MHFNETGFGRRFMWARAPFHVGAAAGLPRNMSYSRIQAIDVVRLRGEPRHAEALRWFYCEIAGLEDATPPGSAGETVLQNRDGRDGRTSALVPSRLAEAPEPPSATTASAAVAAVADAAELRFRSGKIDLTVRLSADRTLESVPYRVTIGVPDLDAVMARLDERRVSYQRFHGLDFSDRRIGLLDPAGNRIYLKQDWPEW